MMMFVGDMGCLFVCNIVFSRFLFNYLKVWFLEWSWFVFMCVWDVLLFGFWGGLVLGDSCVCLVSMVVLCVFFLVYLVFM